MVLTQSIGGLSVDVCSEIPLKEFSADFTPSLVSSSHLSTADIQIKISSSVPTCPAVASNPLFTTQYFRLYGREAGFQLLRFSREQLQTPWFSIHIDQLFSQFCCSFLSSLLPQQVTLDLYRNIADAFLLQHSFIQQQGLILHAAAGSFHGKGLIFAGPSGAGKSTLSLLLNALPQNRLFSDERVIVRFCADAWQVWGSPWHGTGNIARNESAPLAALFFLTQAQETSITPLSPSVGLKRLLQVASIPWYSAEWTLKGLTVCESLVQTIPLFELAFRPDQSAGQAVADLVASLH